MRFDATTFSYLFQFIRWGDLQLLDAASTVAEAEYLRDRGISAGSLHRLLVHMMAAQAVWLSRFNGVSPQKLHSDGEFSTFEALRRQWPLVHAEMEAFLEAQTEQSLSREMCYRDTRGTLHSGLPLGSFVQHVLDHGTYHRGQANTMIRQAGGKPVNFSYYHWEELHRNRQEAR